MCRLSLAWVTSENSTILLESDILRLFFTGPYLVSSPLCSVSGVDCPSVLPRQLLLFASLLSSRNCLLLLASLLSSHQLSFSGPTTNCLSWSPATNSHSRVQLPTASAPVQLPTASLWVASSTLVRVPLPLPDTARFQVQESFVWFRAKTDSSALAAYPHSATRPALFKSAQWHFHN